MGDPKKWKLANRDNAMTNRNFSNILWNFIIDQYRNLFTFSYWCRQIERNNESGNMECALCIVFSDKLDRNWKHQTKKLWVTVAWSKIPSICTMYSLDVCRQNEFHFLFHFNCHKFVKKTKEHENRSHFLLKLVYHLTHETCTHNIIIFGVPNW